MDFKNIKLHCYFVSHAKNSILFRSHMGVIQKTGSLKEKSSFFFCQSRCLFYYCTCTEEWNQCSLMILSLFFTLALKFAEGFYFFHSQYFTLFPWETFLKYFRKPFLSYLHFLVIFNNDVFKTFKIMSRYKFLILSLYKTY